MSILRHLYLSALTCFLLGACLKADVSPSGTFNQLAVDGAVLPVYLHGNRDSKTAIIVIHGGPGESAILKREATGFYRLEEKHLMVYYDQRGSGISAGNVAPSSLSVEQMADDLEAVVALVETLEGVEDIFLISLDWGAAIAVEYLAGDPVSALVKGYITVNPGFNAVRSFDRSRAELRDVAETLLNDNDAANDIPAQNLIDFLDRNAVVDIFNYDSYYRLLEALAGIIYNTGYETSDAVLPQYIKTALRNNEQFVLRHWTYRGEPFLTSLNVDPLLPQIDVPVKIIWGFWNRLFPVSLALEYEDVFSAASAAETVSVFPGSAHRPYLEEGDRFFATVATWVTFYD